MDILGCGSGRDICLSYFMLPPSGVGLGPQAREQPWGQQTGRQGEEAVSCGTLNSR